MKKIALFLALIVLAACEALTGPIEVETTTVICIAKDSLTSVDSTGTQQCTDTIGIGGESQ